MGTTLVTGTGRGRRWRHRLLGLAAGASAAAAFARDQLVPILVVAILIGVLSAWSRRVLDRLVLTGFGARPAVPDRRWRRRQYNLWVAAAEAEADGRHGLSLRLLKDFALSCSTRQAVVAAAVHGRAGELHVRRGELQAAADAARDVDGLLEVIKANRGMAVSLALLSRGRLAVELGDFAGAEANFVEALDRVSRWSLPRTEAALVLADVRARLGRPDDAAAALAPVRPTLVLRGGIDRLVDSEVSIAAAYHCSGASTKARSRLVQALDVLADGLDFFSLEREAVTRFAGAYGRGQLLLGRIELDEGNAEPAARALAAASAQLRSWRAQAVATVLRGVAAVALAEPNRVSRWCGRPSGRLRAGGDS